MSDKGDGSGDNVNAVVPDNANVGAISLGQGECSVRGSDTGATGGRLSEEYAMKTENRGIAIIINNVLFDPETEMDERKGGEVDQEALKQRFTELEFDVREYRDLTVAKMEKLMIKFAGESHKNNDCFMCAVLSHGDKEYVYGADGVSIRTEDLIKPFNGDNCPDLAGKPKIFIIQACRGSMVDNGVEIYSDDNGGRETFEIAQIIPIEADFLKAFSVVEGYVAYRNTEKGSWFVQAISEVFRKYGQREDLITLMTEVNRLVAYEFELKAGEKYVKQMPCLTSTLTKKVYFKPKTGYPAN
ncbi:hypothetical protein LOTGIDRAFT_209997 [Lottia gigantea]|uniref:Caspase family p20 domain-containing protein n=1 Tax=Lottia gigantea TaxID=225164 RepID=V3ZD60_LOTGI|nr:hypothetical protein LOTGIDRAFT_209997 [Lottia gigantea]ESO89043.1 hypothetical protein LOTGIDRAFT_209997 [Lottia gigantea]